MAVIGEFPYVLTSTEGCRILTTAIDLSPLCSSEMEGAEVPQSIFVDRTLQVVRASTPPTLNTLLNRLLASDSGSLASQIRVIRMGFNEIIYEYGDPIDDVFFPL